MPNSHCLDELATYVLEKTRQVIESCGPRPPGSEGEAKAQHLIRAELGCWTDGAAGIESFPVAAKAFLSVPLVTGILLAAALAGYWLSPWLAVVLSGMAVTVALMEFLFYKQFLDVLFPKRTSYNVLGVQKPSGDVKRRLVLNAHPDAAHEWTLLYRFPRVFPLLLYASMVCLGAAFSLHLIGLVLMGWSVFEPGKVRGVIGVLQLAFVPTALLGIAYTSWRHVSPGANDDLSGVFAVTGLARYFRQAGLRMEQTELVYLITGSEEAGLRGAKSYVRRHKYQWQDVETAVITLDTIRDLPHLRILRRDQNGLVPHDPRVCRLLQVAGRRCGLQIGFVNTFLGATDAAAFSKAGIPSAALCAMDPHPAAYYHNRRDNWDNMDPVCIRKTAEVLLAAIHEYDIHGLAEGELP